MPSNWLLWLSKTIISRLATALLTHPPVKAKLIMLQLFLVAQFFTIVHAEIEFKDACLVQKPYSYSATDQSLLNGETTIEADTVSGTQGVELIFKGNVILRQPDREVRANEVHIYENPRRIEVIGNISAQDQDLFVTAGQGNMQNETNESVFNDVEYSLSNINASGNASRVSRTGNVATLEQATYSTCPGINPAWQIKAEELVLNQDTGFGSAKNASFSFMGVPLIYTPGVSFPISDQRKTGFLFPSMGQDSILGLEVALPFYWNIAPQMDATITPHIMTKRGLMLENQFRYLEQKHQGIFQVNYLPDDRQVNRDRYLYSIEHFSKPMANWSTAIVGSAVSDDDYIEDFGNDLGFVSTSFLSRSAELRYRDLYTTFALTTKGYQAVDPNITNANRPYHLLPRMTYRRKFPQQNHRLNVSVTGEYSQFTHPQRTEGERLHIRPNLSYNYSNISGFVRPSFSWHMSQYETDVGSFSRSVPIFSLDSGLFFERTTSEGALQTLEPRIYYLYAPNRDQSGIPLFDTTEPPFGFNTLFRENRYTGFDRIGDANQVSIAVTTRVQEEDKSYETLSASIGQTLYFNDPEVTLNSASVNPEARSGFVADVIYKPDAYWSLRSSLSIDSSLSDTEVFRSSVNYNGRAGQLFNLEHIYRRAELEQTGISAAWPIKDNWVGLGRWLYSHRDSGSIETLIGLEYDSCCWKIRAVAERHINDTGTDFENTFYLQLLFKGLASIGKGSEILQKEITGYETFE